jgi:hypothetical protein
MASIRLFLAAMVLLTIVGCGRREKEPEVQPAAVSPVAADRDQADALFREFFEDRPEESAQQQRTATVPVSQPAQPRSFTFVPNGRYVVQISTVASPELANSIVRRFERMGYPAYVAQVVNPTTSLIGTYYRVRIGGFNTTSEAKDFGEVVLRPLGYDFWVDNRSNDHLGISGVGLGTYAVDHDSRPQPTPAPQPIPQPEQPFPQPVPEPEPTPVFEVEETPAPTPVNDNDWDNFEW